MAWTLQDLDNLEAAMASGAAEVRYGDKSVRYQSTTAMLAARDLIRQALGLIPSSPKKYYAKHSKGL